MLPSRSVNLNLYIRASKRELRDRAAVYYIYGSSIIGSKIFDLSETPYKDAKAYYDNLGR